MLFFLFSDDPYYCGLRARVPNFVNGSNSKPTKDSKKPITNNKNKGSSNPLSPPPSRSTPNLPSLAQLPGAAPPFWWHSRLYPDSGIGGNWFSIEYIFVSYGPESIVNTYPITRILGFWGWKYRPGPLATFGFIFGYLPSVRVQQLL